MFAAREEKGDALALIGAGEALTFAALVERVEDCLARFDRLHATLDGAQPIALHALPRPATIYWIYACLARRIPLVLLHPRATAAERRQLAHAAGAAWAIEGEQIEALEVEPAFRERWRGWSEQGAMALIFTSGSEGRARGVLLKREACLAAARASAAHLGSESDDRWLLCLPLAHAGGLALLLRALYQRQPLVLSDSLSFEPEKIAAAIESHRVRCVSFVPTMVERMLHELPAYRPPPWLRLVLVGGAAAAPSMLQEARRRGYPLRASYGMSETLGQVATQREGEDLDPLPGVELRIREERIELRSPTMMMGYLEEGELHPAQDAEGWLRTGDRGELIEGRLRVLGRFGDLVHSGGEKVDPLEVEHLLAEVAEVRALCVFGLKDRHWGEVVAAAVVAEMPLEALLPKLQARLRAHLAPYKHPRRWVALTSLVYNATGKLDRRATQRLALESLQKSCGVVGSET